MKRFFSIHRAPGLSKEDFDGGASEMLENTHASFVRGLINLHDGTIVNVYDAEDEDSLIQEFERLGWPFHEIHELQLETTPESLGAQPAAG